jgi:hypothetical protein
MIIIPQFDYACDFSEGKAVVEIDDKYGYIDNKGNLLVDFCFDLAHDFSKGLGSVNVGGCFGKHGFSGGKWGYVDNKGNMVVAPIFDETRVFSEGTAPVKIDGKWGFMDVTGQMTLPRTPFDGQ